MKFFNNLSAIKLIVYSYFITGIFLVFPYLLIVSIFNIHTGGFDFENANKITIFFLLVVLGPILETLLFQAFIIYIINKVFPNKDILAIVISAFLFGLNHTYSTVYMIYTFLVGVVFSYIYILSKKKEYNSILIVFSIHSLLNLTLFAINHV